ncbi:MAG: LamG domain-containing protein [Candidatus Bathyarchaeota archaeon]|nr:LamG domain-containing protein [Candidatus Bathyarchaeota archaeon]
MNTSNRKVTSGLILTLVLTIFTTLMLSVHAQGVVDAYTVGLWHLDEILPDGYRQITADATGVNHGIVGVDTSNMVVEGKFDRALRFNGENFVYVPISFLVGFPPSPQPIYIPISPNLNIQEEIKLEAWINVQEFTNATYNNIIVKCDRRDASWENVSRVVGLAIRSGVSEDGVSVPQGALSGFVFTDTGGANEIVTTEPVIPLNQWLHVAFTRTATGMHLYVNGYEQEVRVIRGVQNPVGKIVNGTEYYFGHDSKIIIDEVKISNTAPGKTLASQIDIGSNMLTAIIVVAVVFAVAWVLRRAIQMWIIHSRS